jgi:transposase
VTTDSGVWRRLRRWAIAWKVGRPHLISPDPEYTRKCSAIQDALARARLDPLHVRVVFGDEMSYYRRPAPGREWHEQGRGGCMQPTAPQAPGSNTRRRIIGALDAISGRVTSMTRSAAGVRALLKFLRQLRAAYEPGMHLILVWDNWPPHHHEDVRALAAELDIELLYTPTYAPWTNYIEKLWKKLRAELLRLHRFSDAWVELRRRVNQYLAALDRPNTELLRYVGLAS